MIRLEIEVHETGNVYVKRLSSGKVIKCTKTTTIENIVQRLRDDKEETIRDIAFWFGLLEND